MSQCGPGCTHPSHKGELAPDERARLHDELAKLAPPPPDPPFLVTQAFRDLLYWHTPVGRLLQKVDRMTGRLA